MAAQTGTLDDPAEPRILLHAPEDLTGDRLVRIGEGINKVVFASSHWVVKRQRRPSEIIALICVWKILRRLDLLLPNGIFRRLLDKPGKQIRFVRAVFQIFVVPVPRFVWPATHVGELWKWHSSREVHGQILADAYLAGSSLVPGRVLFPPTRLKIAAWPGWLLASEATERVEATLEDRINELARTLRFDDIGMWLARFLEFRKCGWRRGVLSLDPHLKNYGVVADRVVLLDAGGLTNNWHEIENRLKSEDDYESPHVRLGLEMTLRDRPDIAQHFNERWKEETSLQSIRDHWRS